MKHGFAMALVAALGLSLGTAGQAQTRHDEKPHGMPKNVATADKKPVKQSGIAGRHDERPHGVMREAPAAAGSK